MPKKNTRTFNGVKVVLPTHKDKSIWTLVNKIMDNRNSKDAVNLLHRAILQKNKADNWGEKKAKAAADGIDLDTTVGLPPPATTAKSTRLLTVRQFQLTESYLMSPEPALSRAEDIWKNDGDTDKHDWVDEHTIMEQATDGSFRLAFDPDEDVALINAYWNYMYPSKARDANEQARLFKESRQSQLQLSLAAEQTRLFDEAYRRHAEEPLKT
ncbi:hypothetical protein BKA64DRAFT_647819 [Cadophora sp. MPI-SDFR-AT-0126]|nr:hypothetical protein BKA64DRAFT_647819 [Leotiomycetes sp. MPI-SDFR-AT-0126]